MPACPATHPCQGTATTSDLADTIELANGCACCRWARQGGLGARSGSGGSSSGSSCGLREPKQQRWRPPPLPSLQPRQLLRPPPPSGLLALPCLDPGLAPGLLTLPCLAPCPLACPLACSIADELFGSFENLLALSDKRGVPYDRWALRAGAQVFRSRAVGVLPLPPLPLQPPPPPPPLLMMRLCMHAAVQQA